MNLYATVTSERATKGQGGEYLDIEVRDKRGIVAFIDVREDEYGISILLHPIGNINNGKTLFIERNENRIINELSNSYWEAKGKQQKGD